MSASPSLIVPMIGMIKLRRSIKAYSTHTKINASMPCSILAALCVSFLAQEALTISVFRHRGRAQGQGQYTSRSSYVPS